MSKEGKEKVRSLKITATDLAVSNEGVTKIASVGLAESLVKSQRETVELLQKEFYLFAEEDLSIDDMGRVVIHNKKFAEAVKKKLDEEWQVSIEMGGKPPKNLACGVKC